jgi:hypothetical protein
MANGLKSVTLPADLARSHIPTELVNPSIGNLNVAILNLFLAVL